MNVIASKAAASKANVSKAQANASKAEFGEAAGAASGNTAEVPPKAPLVQPKPKGNSTAVPIRRLSSASRLRPARMSVSSEAASS